MSIRVSSRLFVLFLGVSTTAGAQKVRVALSMSDSATGGLFGSAFSNAFRSLGDVEVVSLLEKPELVLEGVVLCDPSDCSNALSYNLSLRLYSPYDPFTGELLAAVVTPSLPKGTYKVRVDSATKFLNRMLSDYEVSHMTWTATWGRSRYEQAVREFVGRVDAQCLEKKRASRRLALSTDTSRFTTYGRLLRSQAWLC